MNIKSILATAIGLTMAASTNYAQAGSLATAFIDTSNFIISVGNTGQTVVNNQDIGGLAFNSNASAGASLTGFAPITTGTVNSTNPAVGIDLYQPLGSVPGSYTQNSYSSQIFSSANGQPSANFAFGDQLEINSPISGLGGAAVGAHLYNNSTAGLVSEGNAGATSNNGLVSTWTFTAQANTFLTFTFDFAVYLESFVSNGLVNPSTSNSAASQVISLFDITTGLNLGSTNMLATTANANLIFNTGVNSPDDNGTPNFFGASLGNALVLHGVTFATPDLIVNHKYRLVANTLTSASTTDVPEPGMLALLGIGMLGLAGMRKKA